MKKLMKIIGLLLAVIVVTVSVMAVTNICPPQGPWPAPPWCPGSTIPWPFSDMNNLAASGDEAGTAPGEEGSSAADDGQSEGEDQGQFGSTISENERLAQVAIGLVEDLSSVNSYFNDAASSVSGLNPGGRGSAASSSGSSTGTSGSGADGATGQIPAGFTDPLPASGYIPAPPGACAVGATPSASFLNGGGEKITPELLAAKEIQAINFDALTGGSMDGNQLQGTITSLITPGDQALGTPAGWNQKIWSQMAQYQTPAESLMDYHLWSVSGDIEAAVVDSMRASLEGMGLPAPVLNAFNNSQTSGWYAGSPPSDDDRIAAMEIEAVFSGRTEGTIYEQRDFSLPNLGEMPQFGPMDGEGSVTYHDPDFGDYPFDLDIEWTKWDELGRVTEGKIIFTGEGNDVVIEMFVYEDSSREAHVFRAGLEVGIVFVDVNGEITYQDLTE